jgi:hypothetical protein
MCIYALINQLICITNNGCLIGITKLFARIIFRTEGYKNSRTQRSAAGILVLREF